MTVEAVEPSAETLELAAGEGKVRARKPAGPVRRSLRLWRARIGLALLFVVVGFALIGPHVAPFGETEFVGRPNTRHIEGTWLGSDYLGQDVWSRFLHGGTEILLFAVAATGLGLLGGTTVGLIAAYNRGRLDEFMMRAVDIMLSIPQLLLVLVAMTTVGVKTWVIVFTVALTTTPRVARVVRGSAIVVVERDFVAAAEALGESRFRILRSELLPNISAPLLVEANLRLTYSIAIFAGLGFLGFQTAVNTANWGSMIQENRAGMVVQPWGVILPAIAVAVLTLGTGLFSDGLARANAGIDRGRD